MTNNPNNPELPERLTQDLRALGGAKAPEELWERVQLGLALGQVEKAPEELWGQVQLGLALGEVEKAPADLWSRVQPQLAAIAEPESQKPAGRVLHNQAWGRRLSIAAALMICAGIGYRFMGPAQVDPGAALAGPVSAADRAAFRAKVVFMEVSSKELSSVANSFAEGFGGITAEDDA
ncbi:MAG: hypothetical protein GY747_08030 [Planctomycetes bacterium]|nr:hypothetical protein [Planctomycetota bacterium]MCP4771130.1 hypothetical protein [Planctomycetota bacterium]MCP4862143.1 hypothetical protein [Planctomycetota bacterium]